MYQVPNGGIGPDAPEPLIDSDFVAKNTFAYRKAERPSQELQASLSWFLASGRIDHALTFGAR